nr:hypothetical protein [Magnetospirillum aberrantis]
MWHFGPVECLCGQEIGIRQARENHTDKKRGSLIVHPNRRRAEGRQWWLRSFIEGRGPRDPFRQFPGVGHAAMVSCHCIGKQLAERRHPHSGLNSGGYVVDRSGVALQSSLERIASLSQVVQQPRGLPPGTGPESGGEGAGHGADFKQMALKSFIPIA